MGSVCVNFIQGLFELEAYGIDCVCKRVMAILKFLLECPVPKLNANIVC